MSLTIRHVRILIRKTNVSARPCSVGSVSRVPCLYLCFVGYMYCYSGDPSKLLDSIMSLTCLVCLCTIVSYHSFLILLKVSSCSVQDGNKNLVVYSKVTGSPFLFFSYDLIHRSLAIFSVEETAGLLCLSPTPAEDLKLDSNSVDGLLKRL